MQATRHTSDASHAIHASHATLAVFQHVSLTRNTRNSVMVVAAMSLLYLGAREPAWWAAGTMGKLQVVVATAVRATGVVWQ
jgi:hypothetical protein